MSTIDDLKAEIFPEPGSPEDPYRYGWRYRPVKQPNGRVEVEQVPLTLEDLLFPEEGDQTPQLPSHVDDCIYIKMAIETKLDGDPEALVLCDCRIDWNLPGVRPLGPDIAVFLGVPGDFDRGTFKVAEFDGVRPVLVVEITSPDTRKNDFGVKKVFYERAQVPFYIIVDARPGGERRRVKLLGYRLSRGRYRPIPLDDRGRLRIDPLGLRMTIDEDRNRVACFDVGTDERILSHVELIQAHAKAEARVAAAQERSRADAAARAEAEQRSRADAAARAALEARLLAMEAENRRLGGEG